MGILNWLRTLLSRKAVHCDVCRERIKSSDFVRGLAVVVARKKFCRHCVEYVTRHHEGRPFGRAMADLSSSTTPILG